MIVASMHSMRRFFGHIIIACVSAFASIQTACADDFASFLIGFFSQPASQTVKAKYPLNVGNMVVKSPAAFRPYRCSGSVAVVCADSLSGASAGVMAKSISFISLSNNAGQCLNFSKQKNSWMLTSAYPLASNSSVDSDFASFLAEFSNNPEFQMRRSIFPLPMVNMDKSGVEVSRKLLMPREWQSVNFVKSCPEVIFFDNSAKASNRRLYFYNKNELSRIYTFIKLNNKWMLIEIENY